MQHLCKLNEDYILNDTNTVLPKLKVGIDDGAADTKVAVIGPSGIVRQVCIPSRARSGINGTTSLGDLSSKGSVFTGYETEGSRFTVGDFRDSETAQFDEYPFSGMNRVIIAHAIRVAGLAGQKIDIATGLPLSVYYRSGEPNESVIEAKKASIRKPVFSLDGSQMFEIGENNVYPEGLAAFIDYAIDDVGNLRVDMQETVGIIDIGGRTTDMAVVVPGGSVDHARSGSENIGVLDLAQALGIELKKIFGSEIPAYMLDSAMRTGVVSAWGKKHDIREALDASAEDVMQRIMREINRRFGTGIDLDKILLVGGGSKVFGKVALQYPNVIIPEGAQFSNARGFAKFLNL